MPKNLFTPDGKRTSVREIRAAVTDDLLQDFIAGGAVQRNLKISAAHLSLWRKQAKIRAVKWKGQWYYSRVDLASLLNS